MSELQVQNSFKENSWEYQSKSQVPKSHSETSLTEQELSNLRQTFNNQLKWCKILRRKVDKLKRKLKLKIKAQNKLIVQRSDLVQKYKQCRRTLRKEKLAILLEIKRHLKYLKSMAYVIKSAQKIYMQERKVCRKRLFNVKKEQEKALNEIKPKVQRVQQQLSVLNTEINNLKSKIAFYEKKRDEMYTKTIANKVKADKRKEEIVPDSAKIVYEKAEGTNIVGFQMKLPEQKLRKLQNKDRETAVNKLQPPMLLEKPPSETKVKGDLKKPSNKKSVKIKFKPRSITLNQLTVLASRKEGQDSAAESLVVPIKSQKVSTNAVKSKARLPIVDRKVDSDNLKPNTRKLLKRKKKSGKSVFYVSNEASVVAPMAGIIEKPIDKNTMQSITLPTKGQGFMDRHFPRRLSSSTTMQEYTSDTKLLEEQDVSEELEDEEQTSFTQFISLYNVHENKIITPARNTSVDSRLPSIKEDQHPTLSFGAKFFKDLVKSQRSSIRQKLILEREHQKKLERELLARQKRERDLEISSERSNSVPENKLDMLVKRALQSTFRHADVIRKDLPIVDEEILKTYKSKTFLSDSMAFLTARQFDWVLDDESETELQKTVESEKPETVIIYQQLEEKEELGPRLTVEELIKRYYDKVNEEKKKVAKRVKKIKKRKKCKKSKKKETPTVPEEQDKPELVCSCCGMVALHIIGPCCTSSSQWSLC